MILVDTHVVAWLAFEPKLISRAATDAACVEAEGLAISGITLFELAILASKGRVRLNISVESFLQEVEARFAVLPRNGRVCARATERSAPIRGIPPTVLSGPRP